jgi:hypothetical protein
VPSAIATNPFTFDASSKEFGITTQIYLTLMDGNNATMTYTATWEVLGQSVDFTINVLNPCVIDGKVTVTPATQATLNDDKYTGTIQTFTYTPFTVSPTFCTLSKECSQITGPSSGILLTSNYKLNDSIDSVDLSFDSDDYIEGFLTPGTYNFEYIVYPKDSGDPNLISTFSFDYTLVDPCLDAAFTVPSGLTDQEYTITDV